MNEKKREANRASVGAQAEYIQQKSSACDHLNLCVRHNSSRTEKEEIESEVKQLRKCSIEKRR